MSKLRLCPVCNVKLIYNIDIDYYLCSNKLFPNNKNDIKEHYGTNIYPSEGKIEFLLIEYNNNLYEIDFHHSKNKMNIFLNNSNDNSKGYNLLLTYKYIVPIQDLIKNNYAKFSMLLCFQ